MTGAWMRYGIITCAAGLILLVGCAPSVRYRTVSEPVVRSSIGTDPQPNMRLRGLASYYHDKFEGRITSSGEPFRQDRLTAAHPTLPFGTIVRVTNLQNRRSVVVRINDRGPFVEGRILDLTRAAAAQLDMLSSGVAEVELVIVEHPQ